MKLLLSSRSLLHQRDGGAPPAAERSAGLLPYFLRVFSTSTSTAAAPPSTYVNPISSHHHQRNAWRQQLPSSTSSSGGDISNSCTFVTSTSVKASILLFFALLFSILLHLNNSSETSEQLLKPFSSAVPTSDSPSKAGSEVTTARETNEDGQSFARELPSGGAWGLKLPAGELSEGTLSRGQATEGRLSEEEEKSLGGREPGADGSPALLPRTSLGTSVRRGEETSSSTGSSIDIKEEAERCSREVLKVFVYDIPLAFSTGFVKVHFRNHVSNWEAALWSNETVPMLSELTQIPQWRDGSLIRMQYNVEHYLTADMLAAPA